MRTHVRAPRREASRSVELGEGGEGGQDVIGKNRGGLYAIWNSGENVEGGGRGGMRD